MIFQKLEDNQKLNQIQSLALIDPDKKNDSMLLDMIKNINHSGFDAILVGGSHIDDNRFDERIKIIKNSTKLPVIIFPGDSTQISKHADAILFTSLISGRNPKYLIEEQVKSSQLIHQYKLETIPTGYLLLKTDKKSAVEIISNTLPLDMNNEDLILSHALAAQYLGKKIIFLEAGSNSNLSVKESLIKKISQSLDIPIMVGGGIKDKETALNIAKNGASYIVIGSLIEQSKDISILSDINKSLHAL